MTKYSIGDRVSWNSEAGRVSGRIIRVHHRDFDYKGHRRRASPHDPQYEIESDKTDHVAAHKEAALTKIGCDFPLNLKNRLTIISRRYAGT